MGKFEHDQSLPPSVLAEISNSDRNGSNCLRFVRLKCIIVVILGIAVFVSALFSFPLFKEYAGRSDLDSLIRAHEVVANFKLHKPVSFLKENIPQIELDIYNELAIPNTTVVVIYLEALAESNTSNVVFAVVPDSKSSCIPPSSLSLLKSSFLSLVLRQSFLRLNSFLGDPFSFEVLKFKGGITVIPEQSVFPLQNQTFFTFKLNFAIYRLQDKFKEFKSQLTAGLHLRTYENVYICLINSNGSTVAPPTTIQVSVLLTIGNRSPSSRRLKQLARTITGPHARNLGLNNTVFGKVKQVQLSAGMEHSLNGSGSSPGAPSPAPLPHPSHRRHHDVNLTPSPAPVSYRAKPPSGCRVGSNRKAKKHFDVVPTVAPVASKHHSDAPQTSHVNKSPAPASSPKLSHIQPPNKAVEPPSTIPSHSPMPSSSAGHLIHPPSTLFLLFAMLVL